MKMRVMAIASAGGHWEQLMLLSEALPEGETIYVTTRKGLAERAGVSQHIIVPDCNRNTRIKCVVTLSFLLLALIRYRPKVIITTGALPGMMGLMLGKLYGARTIWIDSVANAEEFSASGRSAKRFSDYWLSQWRHVSEVSGAIYSGRLL